MPYTVLDPSSAELAPATSLGDPLQGQPGLTFDDMRKELGAQLAGRQDVSTARIGLWLNLGYVDLCTSLLLDDLEGSVQISTVADQGLYQLPGIIRTIRTVSLIDSGNSLHGGGKLDRIDREAYRALPEQRDKTPAKFFRYKGMLVVWPTPTSVRNLVVDFRLRPVFMVDVADQPILPAEWHEAVIMAGRWKAHSALLEYEDAAVAEKNYLDFVRRRRTVEEDEDGDRLILSSVPRNLTQLRRAPFLKTTPEQL